MLGFRQSPPSSGEGSTRIDELKKKCKRRVFFLSSPEWHKARNEHSFSVHGFSFCFTTFARLLQKKQGGGMATHMVPFFSLLLSLLFFLLRNKIVPLLSKRETGSRKWKKTKCIYKGMKKRAEPRKGYAVFFPLLLLSGRDGRRRCSRQNRPSIVGSGVVRSVEQACVHVVPRQVGIFGEKEVFFRGTVGDGAYDILNGQPAALDPRPAAARVWRRYDLGSHEPRVLGAVSVRACHKKIGG